MTKRQASKLRERDSVYVLQAKADQQESKIAFTEYQWNGLGLVEKSF